jgi:ABC-type nitrate/sulfonate/bicarbonate transport system permease component
MPLEGSLPPDPRFLWLKGQTLKRWEQERRFAMLAERMQVGLGIAGALGLFAWLWRLLSTTGASAVTLEADFSRALPILLVISLFMLIVTVGMTARDPVAQ